MRLVLVLLVLGGCATQPKEPTAQQLAVLAYYIERCQKQGIQDELALKGCIRTLYFRDVNAGAYGGNHFGNVLQGMGQALSPAPQQTCTTRPDYAGGWVTTCR